MKRSLTFCIRYCATLLLMCPSGFGAEIHEAAQTGELDRVGALLADDSTLLDLPDQAGRTPLHWACRGTSFETVAHLLDAGAEVNPLDVNGMIPLHSAASRGYVDATRSLIEHGAQVNRTSAYDSGTPLHYAAEGGHAEVANILLRAGARIYLQDRYYQTPLHLAVAGGHTETVEALCERVDLNNREVLDSPDFDGNTALHLACVGKDAGMARALIMAGANIDARNAIGESAFNLGEAAEAGGTVDLLVSHGADQSPPRFPMLRGPYLGQSPPGTTPRLFAPGIVSRNRGLHANIDFSPDLREAIWESRDTLFWMRMNDSMWSAPEKLHPFDEGYSMDAPFFSPGGDRLYMVAGPRDTSGQMDNEQIWFLERHGSRWSSPRLFDSAANTLDIHWQASMDGEGNLYTSAGAVYCSRLVNGQYLAPERLPDIINAVPDSVKPYAGEVGPFIGPDGDYLIFNRFSPPPPSWSVDLLVSFRDSHGDWRTPMNLGEQLGGTAGSPRVSPDGKYLFFLSDRPGAAKERSVYWMDAAVIDRLRPENL